MTIGLTEPNQKGDRLARPFNKVLNNLTHDETNELLLEIDNDLSKLQDEINDRINDFISNHKYAGNLEIIALDKTILKIKDRNERSIRIGQMDGISPGYFERDKRQQYVFLTPQLWCFDEDGTPGRGQGMHIIRF